MSMRVLETRSSTRMQQETNDSAREKPLAPHLRNEVRECFRSVLITPQPKVEEKKDSASPLELVPGKKEAVPLIQERLKTLLGQIQTLQCVSQEDMQEWAQTTQARNWDHPSSDKERVAMARELCFPLLCILGPALEVANEEEEVSWVEINDELRALVQEILPEGKNAKVFIENYERMLQLQRETRLKRSLNERHLQTLNAHLDTTVERVQGQMETWVAQVRQRMEALLEESARNGAALQGRKEVLQARMEHVVAKAAETRRVALDPLIKLSEVKKKIGEQRETCRSLVGELL